MLLLSRTVVVGSGDILTCGISPSGGAGVSCRSSSSYKGGACLQYNK